MQQLVWGHKGNLNSIDGLSCHSAGCMQAESFSLYRPGQQQISRTGRTEAEGPEEPRVTGQDGRGGDFRQEDIGVCPQQRARGFMDGCCSPRCIVGSRQADKGAREIPRAFSVIFLFLSCSRHSSAEKCAGLLASVGKRL